MTKNEALKMCLEYIETDAHERKYVRHAIKKALAQPEPWEKFCDSNCVWTDHHPDCKMAQPEQEPVAYLAWKEGKPCYEGDDAVCEDAVWPVDIDDDRTSMPVYTTPPQRTWVGLTKKEFQEAVEGLEDLEDCWVAIEAKIKDKNT